MKYNNAISYIEQIGTFGSKPELKRIRSLLKCLGNPQDKLNIIHIAGTNGKGSTCVMIESILLHAGYNVGLYTSPHLIKYNERIRINKIDIDDNTFGEISQQIVDKCYDMTAESENSITIFEFLTALAFCYFAQNKLDYVILETGMGGKYDATNIISSPILSVITSIGMDHMEYLGDTIEQIATEKGGIIKQNCPVVLYPKVDEISPPSDKIYEIIKNICVKNLSELYYIDNLNIKVDSENLYQLVFCIKTKYYTYNKLKLNMAGDYQLYNAATALLAVKALQDIGVKLNETDIINGIEQAHWRGRMEIISNKPCVLLDGAHNLDGIEMLSQYIERHLFNKDITLLIGMLKDKEYKKMLDRVVPLVSRLVITEPASSRTLTLESVEAIISIYNLPIYKEKNIGKAFEIAKSITQQDEILICAGSLYLIGELEKLKDRGYKNA